MGISPLGDIVEADKLTPRDRVVEIRYLPGEQGGEPEIFVFLPDRLFEWTMMNAEDTRLRAGGTGIKLPRKFLPGANEFAFQRTKIFKMTMGRAPEIHPHASSSSSRERPPEIQPQSSSSSSANKRPDVFSRYDVEIMGYDDPVPHEFLITLVSGSHEEHFHCFSLIAAMLSQDAPENPMNKEVVPKDTLRQISEKIGVDTDDFINIWVNAHVAYPKSYQYDQRRERRFELFRAMINSNQGSPKRRQERSEIRALMAQRDDWEILIRK